MQPTALDSLLANEAVKQELGSSELPPKASQPASTGISHFETRSKGVFVRRAWRPASSSEPATNPASQGCPGASQAEMIPGEEPPSASSSPLGSLAQ